MKKGKQYDIFGEAHYTCEICGTTLDEAKDLCDKDECSQEWEKRFDEQISNL
jgi:hypothetical protein